MPPNQTWRMFGDFRASCAYFDIETTGMSAYDEVTAIALYDGRAVFFKAENPEKNQAPADALPQRRIQTLADAAAWIQQNWPDFDLETNCPATWRGSR